MNRFEQTVTFSRLQKEAHEPLLNSWAAIRGRLDTKLVGDMLERWPSLEELQKVPPAELRKFFRQRPNLRF